MNLTTLLDTLMEKAVWLSPVDQLQSKWTLAIQKFVIDCLSYLAGGLDTLKEKLHLLDETDIILVGRHTERTHIWLSRPYSLFCGKRRIKQSCFLKPTIQKVLLKKTK